MPTIRPQDSPHYKRNRAAHLARWAFVPPEHPSDDIHVEAVALRAVVPSPWHSWPEGMLLRARLHARNGSWIAVHSERAPLEEAEAWCQPVLSARSPAAVAVIGAGLGYAIDVLTADSPTNVLVLEPEPAFVAWLLARRDWTPLIDAGRLMVLSAPAYDAAPHAWKLFQRAGHTAPPVLVHPVIGRERATATVEAGRLVAKAIHGAQANATARRRFEAPYLLNTVANIRHVVRAPHLDSCAGLAHGRPVVIAGAGPSLDRNLEELGAYRDRVVLVAADTAFRPLEHAGFPPDFVVAVDPGELNARHLAGARASRQTTLVAEASVHPSSFEPFGDRVVTFRVADHAPWPWLTSLGIEPGRLRAWGSVLTSAFDLALRLGGDPIVFIGADLAYTGGQPYCRGTVYEDDWATASRADGVDLATIWERSISPRAVEVPDLRGEATRTASHLVAFRDWLVDASRAAAVSESDRPTVRVINATGAGILYGPGVQLLPLSEALASAPDNGPAGVRLSHGRASLPAVPEIDAHLLDQSLTRGSDFPPTVDLPVTGTAYMRRTRGDRNRATRRLRVLKQSDHARWASPDNLDRSWERRPVAAAPLIPPGTRVLDLGAGHEVLRSHLPANTTYVPADIVARSSRTVVVDVNAGEFPDGSYDVVVMLGLLEYVHDVPALLRTAGHSASTLIASYCTVSKWNRDVRLEKGWLSDLSLAHLLDTFNETGWLVGWAGRLDAFEYFDQWLFACRRRVADPTRSRR